MPKTQLIIFFLATCSFIFFGCTSDSPSNQETGQAPTPSMQSTAIIPDLAAALATTTPRPMVTKASEQPISETQPPTVSNLRFALSPDGEPRKSFAHDEDQVVAIFEAKDIQDQTLITIEWNRNGEKTVETFQAEELFVMTDDVYVFSAVENLANVEPGFHSLKMLINNQSQLRGIFFVNGKISRTSQKTGHTAKISKNNKLHIFNQQNDEIFSQSSELEISWIKWHPDGKRLFYSVLDRSNQLLGTPFGLEKELWLLDLNSQEVTLIDNNISLAPTHFSQTPSNFLAAYEGDSYSDGCEFNRRLKFYSIAAEDFSKALVPSDFVDFPLTDERDRFYPRKGDWLSEFEYVTELVALCSYVEGDNINAVANQGVYLFNLQDMTVERIGDIETGD
ncbi:MAG: hypothetical protein AAF985_24735 [Bacteroidota bacterium]